MFKILNEKYSNAFGDQLRPKSINSDCEAALIKRSKFINSEFISHLRDDIKPILPINIQNSFETYISYKCFKE